MKRSLQHTPQFITTFASERDLDFLSTVYNRAYVSEWDQTLCGPGSTDEERAEVAAFFGHGYQAALKDPGIVVLVIRDTAAPENKSDKPEEALPMGFAVWFRPVTGGTKDGEGPRMEFGESPRHWKMESLGRFISVVTKFREKIMRDPASPPDAPRQRPHWYLQLLGTVEEYQGYGAGKLALLWGNARADEDGLEAFLTASPAGWPLYRKHGYTIVDDIEIFEAGVSKVSRACLRAPQSKPKT